MFIIVYYHLVNILHLNVVHSRDRNGEDTHRNVIHDTVLSFGKFAGSSPYSLVVWIHLWKFYTESLWKVFVSWQCCIITTCFTLEFSHPGWSLRNLRPLLLTMLSVTCTIMCTAKIFQGDSALWYKGSNSEIACYSRTLK